MNRGLTKLSDSVAIDKNMYHIFVMSSKSIYRLLSFSHLVSHATIFYIRIPLSCRKARNDLHDDE